MSNSEFGTVIHVSDERWQQPRKQQESAPSQPTLTPVSHEDFATRQRRTANRARQQAIVDSVKQLLVNPRVEAGDILYSRGNDILNVSRGVAERGGSLRAANIAARNGIRSVMGQAPLVAIPNFES